MTATADTPKLVLVNECNYTQCTDKPAITGIKYVRFDAPELLALVEAAQEAIDDLVQATLTQIAAKHHALADLSSESVNRIEVAVKAFTALIAKDTAINDNPHPPTE